MERSEYRTFLQLCNYLVCNELAAYEFLCAMHYTMTYSLDVLESREYARLLVKESINNSLDTYCMILDRHLLYNLILADSLMLDASYLHSDSLDKTFGEKIINLIVLHIEKLVLQ